jgi:hypothetical protein
MAHLFVCRFYESAHPRVEPLYIDIDILRSLLNNSKSIDRGRLDQQLDHIRTMCPTFLSPSTPEKQRKEIPHP